MKAKIVVIHLCFRLEIQGARRLSAANPEIFFFLLKKDFPLSKLTFLNWRRSVADSGPVGSDLSCPGLCHTEPHRENRGRLGWDLIWQSGQRYEGCNEPLGCRSHRTPPDRRRSSTLETVEAEGEAGVDLCPGTERATPAPWL